MLSAVISVVDRSWPFLSFHLRVWMLPSTSTMSPLPTPFSTFWASALQATMLCHSVGRSFQALLFLSK